MNLSRCHCSVCREITLHRGYSCIHCGTPFRDPNTPPAMTFIKPIVRVSTQFRPRVPSKTVRICGWCQREFKLRHPSYPALCCSVLCAQRRRRSLIRNTIQTIPKRKTKGESCCASGTRQAA